MVAGHPDIQCNFHCRLNFTLTIYINSDPRPNLKSILIHKATCQASQLNLQLAFGKWGSFRLDFISWTKPQFCFTLLICSLHIFYTDCNKKYGKYLDWVMGYGVRHGLSGCGPCHGTCRPVACFYSFLAKTWRSLEL